jgi:peptide chain release factor subunit 3
VDEQELKKNEQEAKSLGRQGWELAFITSAIPDEKAKGKTVECSKTLFGLEKRRYTLFDAPGHKNYVPNMIVGACQSDLAVLIISAKMGEYESGFDKEGQTKEHAMLARALGVHSIFCVVTKMDTIEWDLERFNKIQSEVSLFLKNSCGYDKVKFIPIDSLLDINIDSRNYEKACSWYHGESFFEMLDNIDVLKKSP